ncbi:MAG: hypothetical protein QG594_1037 [Bacteroidota bacterium]|nr:hypothetical protein [Bacteroidota bacterium]
MKKNLLLLLAAIGTAMTMNAQNLLLNSGLEAGTGDSFTNWTRSAGTANLTAETTQIHGGVRGLKAVSMGTNEWDVQFQSDAIATVIGTSYEVTFWIKSVGGASTMRVSTVSTGGNAYGAATTIGTTWQLATYAFIANSTATKINFDLGKSTDTFYIDDIEMYTLSKNNILNGGFETTPGASGNIFANWTATNGAAQMTQEGTNFRTGASALKAISTGANEYNVQLQSDAVTTVIGRNYEVAIWVKSVGGISKIRLSTAGGTAVYGNSTTIGTTWQRLALAFKATATATKLSLDLGKSTDTFYIDDAVFNSAQTSSLGLLDFISKKEKISFYPNPVINNLNFISDDEIKSITISNLTGTILKTVKSDNIKTVDLSDLTSGMYILSTDSNKQAKFLKK